MIDSFVMVVNSHGQHLHLVFLITDRTAPVQCLRK